MRFQSHGGGVQSCAMYLHLRSIGRLPDAVIASDTGHEYPETYAAWEHQGRLCAEDGVPFHLVRGDADIIEHFSDMGRLPLPHRRFPTCSTWAKRDRVRRFIKEQYGAGPHSILLGISTDEVGRAKPSDVQWLVNEYPLLEGNVSRQGCERILTEQWTGPPVRKSGCTWCPWMGPQGLARLYHEDRATFDRVQAMEETAKEGSGTLFQGMTVAQIAARAAEGREPPRERDRPTPHPDMVPLMACDNGAGCWT